MLVEKMIFRKILVSRGLIELSLKLFSSAEELLTELVGSFDSKPCNGMFCFLFLFGGDGVD